MKYTPLERVSQYFCERISKDKLCYETRLENRLFMSANNLTAR